jgi:hypothetical protein
MRHASDASTILPREPTAPDGMMDAAAALWRDTGRETVHEALYRRFDTDCSGSGLV